MSDFLAQLRDGRTALQLWQARPLLTPEQRAALEGLIERAKVVSKRRGVSLLYAIEEQVRDARADGRESP